MNLGWTVLQVAAGGALGAAGRHLTGIAAQRLLGSGFPFGTFTVNVLGSLLMGVAFVALGGGAEQARIAPLVMTGFLGGYTTFSAYSLDVWQLIQGGRTDLALAYAVGSAVVSVAALFVGIAAARGILN